MTITKPQVSPNGRYNTTETCLALGISRTTLSRYAQAGTIRPVRLKANMRPYYTGSEILRLWTTTA